MIFKRYSSPFLFLENLIIQGRLCDGIDTIYKQIDEEKMWQLYLSNPIKEQSYVDWKNERLSNNEEETTFEVAENIEDIKNRSRNMLKNFKPQ